MCLPEVSVSVSSPEPTEQLGRLLSVHRRSERFTLVLGCALLGLFPFAFLAGTAPLGTPIVGAVFWPPAVLGLRTSPLVVRGLRRQQIRLYEQGFVVAGADDAPQVWRWDRISVVFERSQRRGITGFRYGASAIYTVVGLDGRTIKLSTEWDGIRLLGREVCLRTAAAQLRSALAALEQGRDLRFGDVVVDATGVRCRRGWAPWPELDFALTRQRRVRLEVADRFRPLASIPAWKIPNVALFIQLMRIYQEKEEQGR